MAAPRMILTVCTANICRSPMAAALLGHALAAEDEPLKSIRVGSAGVAARRGDPPSENSVAALRKAGLDISGHRSQPLTSDLVQKADLILCMTEAHRAMILLGSRPPTDRVFLFREFLPGKVDREIGDPFGGPLRLYEACRDEMVEAIPSLLDHLRHRFA